jgi:hypothetical protein
MFGYDDDGELLPFQYGVDAHFFLFCFAGFLSGCGLQYFEEGLEGFVGATQASCFGAGGAFEFGDEVDDLEFEG